MPRNDGYYEMLSQEGLFNMPGKKSVGMGPAELNRGGEWAKY